MTLLINCLFMYLFHFDTFGAMSMLDAHKAQP